MPSHQSPRKEGEEMQQKRPSRLSSCQTKLPPLNVNDHKNKKVSHSHKHVSPLSSPSPTPTNGPTTRKSSSVRWDCLCSPTTHAGSFRCRRHRAEGTMRRGGSVDSNLFALGSKD